jgi:hypothetical protein
MNKTTLKGSFLALTLCASGAANADFGVGIKAGTLGAGLEGRWSPIPWLDVRVGANRYDFDDEGSQAGINYDAVFSLDTYYATANLRIPLSPFRFTVGAFANNNELQLVSTNISGADFDIGGTTFTASDVGTLTSTTSFDETSPYVGVGYDFEIFGKVGLNFDLGVLWQGEPSVTLQADGIATSLPAFQAALEAERLQLEDDVNDYKAWPVLSLGFVYNF